MKLSQVINYRYQVEQWSTDKLSNHVNTELSKILSDVTAQNIGLSRDQDELVRMGTDVNLKIKEFGKVLEQYKKDMSEIIHELEKPLIQQSYQWYDEAGKNDTPEYIQERYTNNPLITNHKTREHFLSRVKHYSDWKRAGLIIRPEAGDVITPLVDCTPLYIADTHPRLLEQSKSLFSDTFQQRICYYTLAEQRVNIYNGLPEEQLGIVVFYNFFNYLPLEMIEKYLLQLKEHLKPGANVIFTFNDCDYPGAVRNAENVMNTYTPGRLIEGLINKLGYEYLDHVAYPAENVSWIEMKMPGEFKSLRGGQELAKINRPA